MLYKLYKPNFAIEMPGEAYFHYRYRFSYTCISYIGIVYTSIECDVITYSCPDFIGGWAGPNQLI